MICANCGNWMEDGKQSCPNCGAPVMAGGEIPQPEMNMGQASSGSAYMNGTQTGYSQPGMSKKEFYKHPNLSSVKKQIDGCGIVMYALAIINAVIYAIAGDILSAVVSLILMLGLGLGIHLAKSRVCAILLTVYGAVNVIVVFISTGRFSGWLFLLIGVYAIIYTFKFQKAWKQYKNTGIVPLIAGK